MKKGFTILELLVVISVLVILIGIAIPRFKGMQDAARIAQVKGELQTIRTAVESYYINQSPSAYPISSNTLGSDILAGVAPKVIPDVIPYDPFGSTTSTEYRYMRNNNYYVIGSVGTGTDLASLAITSAGVASKNAANLCASNGSGC